MQKYIIKLNEDNQRIDKFLLKKYKNLSQSELYRSFRKNKIKVNNKKVKFDYIISENDSINLYINDDLLLIKEKNLSFLKCNIDIINNICYEDKNILILNKNREIKVHDGENSLLNASLKYLYNKNELNLDSENYFTPAFSNRLDTNTSGLIILCKNPLAIKEMNDIIKNYFLIKYYSAICLGNLNVKNETFKAFLIKNDDNTVKVMLEKHENSKEILTKIDTIKSSEVISFLNIELLTGRTHQIRAHLKCLGYPILGDNKYGNLYVNKKFNIFTQCLSANKLVFKIENKENYKLLSYLDGKNFYFEDKLILKLWENFK
ncbi:MAG: pseudouridine synthase [Oscillospiraceae bacterium]